MFRRGFEGYPKGGRLKLVPFDGRHFMPAIVQVPVMTEGLDAIFLRPVLTNVRSDAKAACMTEWLKKSGPEKFKELLATQNVEFGRLVTKCLASIEEGAIPEFNEGALEANIRNLFARKPRRPCRSTRD